MLDAINRFDSTNYNNIINKIYLCMYILDFKEIWIFFINWLENVRLLLIVPCCWSLVIMLISFVLKDLFLQIWTCPTNSFSQPSTKVVLFLFYVRVWKCIYNFQQPFIINIGIFYDFIISIYTNGWANIYIFCWLCCAYCWPMVIINAICVHLFLIHLSLSFIY